MLAQTAESTLARFSRKGFITGYQCLAEFLGGREPSPGCTQPGTMHMETLNHTASSSSRSPAAVAAARPLAQGTGCLMSADCLGETL